MTMATKQTMARPCKQALQAFGRAGRISRGALRGHPAQEGPHHHPGQGPEQDQQGPAAHQRIGQAQGGFAGLIGLEQDHDQDKGYYLGKKHGVRLSSRCKKKRPRLQRPDRFDSNYGGEGGIRTLGRA